MLVERLRLVNWGHHAVMPLPGALGQGVVLDSNGLLLGGLGSLSNGLHLRVGQ